MSALSKNGFPFPGKLAHQVESWFRANARDLPWRRTLDPYAIWISEVMLQQTQVKTVVPYWERWMKLFPTATALAKAPEEEVLKAWEGLGYYTRVRNLQKAARQIAVSGGTFPTSYDAVLALPGIGRYTAGAICSIAFGQTTPILDGNVTRVLCRLAAVGGAPKDPQVQQRLWELSTQLVTSAKSSSDLNQGLMELGATICVPRDPYCPKCPLRKKCQAHLRGEIEHYPEKSTAIEYRDRAFAALIVTDGGRVLVRKRPENVVNGGLWEFPNFEVSERQFRGKLRELELQARPLRTIKHTITRNRITLKVFTAAANGNSAYLAEKLASEWRPIRDLNFLPFSSAHARLRTFLHGPDAK